MTVTAGLPPSTALLPLPAVSLVAEERTLKGSYIGTCVPSRDIPRYIDLYPQGRLPVNKLLTGRLTLDEINHGFDLLHEGKAIRQVVVVPMTTEQTDASSPGRRPVAIEHAAVHGEHVRRRSRTHGSAGQRANVAARRTFRCAATTPGRSPSRSGPSWPRRARVRAR